MSVLSLKRTLSLLAVICSASPLFGIAPAARYETRMVYDPATTHMILFGGATATDSGTKTIYRLSDTWDWTGLRWIQRYPAQTPAGRSGHILVYDSNRDRIAMFGGRGQTADLNDMWVYEDQNWTQLMPPNVPPVRFLAGAAYDPIRDRIVMFGGDQTTVNGLVTSLTPIYDTWEFDGTTWKQIGGTGPSVSKPILAYDVAHNQVIMLGVDSNVNSLMYSYDPVAGAWNQVKPSTLPPCVNEGEMIWNPADQKVLYLGGVCSSSAATDADYEWDGTNWTALSPTSAATRLFGAGADYDASRSLAVMFGGTPTTGIPVNDTWLFSSNAWITFTDYTRPDPRSLFVFAADPVNKTIWMFGGEDGVTERTDLWQYQSGTWMERSVAGGPTTCITPLGAWDTDRNKLVISCADGTTYEWDGSVWSSPTPKTTPSLHQWGSIAYDQNLKKTVVFGGYNSGNATYSNETWLWDGTNWNRITNSPPTARTLAAMWYDPNLKKTVIYGGIGRATSNDRITRYNDMWSFDGSGWTQMNPTSGTPGMRYGAQVVVDPNTNHVMLFGGMRDDPYIPTPPATTPTEIQSYVNDMWQWDGTTWTKLSPASVATPRENGGMAFDPTTNQLVLFGGYAGYFLSDLWIYGQSGWQVYIFDPLGNRRRVVP